MGAKNSCSAKGDGAVASGKVLSTQLKNLQCSPCVPDPVVHATHARQGDASIEGAVAGTVVVEGQVCAGVAYDGGLEHSSSMLSMYRCRFCNGYVSRAEFDTACRYHPGKFVARGGAGHAWSKWSCCDGTVVDHPPCAKRPTHTEDLTFSSLARELGCEMSESQRHARVESLNEMFGPAFDGNAIRVAVQKSSATVVILVPAPPTPTIAHVKAILRSDYPRFAGRNVQLGAAPVRPMHPVIPFDDSLPLGQLRPMEKRRTLHPAQLTPDGALSIFVLEAPGRDERSGASRGDDWVKVALHPGDTLAKLALQHNLDISQIKAANNIIGSTIEGWRDDIWLPPLAALRPAPPPGKVDYVAKFRLALRAAGDRGRVETEEAEAYLAMVENDVQAAVNEWLADGVWASERSPLLSATPAGVGMKQRKPVQEMTGGGRPADGMTTNLLGGLR